MNAVPGLLRAPYAHRGLWSPGGPPENSLAAFEAACSAGYGVELDVQLTADGEVVVFHDETLERMTAHAGIVEERPVAELVRMKLAGGQQTIPTLAQALATIAGRTTVLIELKTPVGQEGLLEQRVADLVRSYAGPFALIGFNIEGHAWLARHEPDLPRGLNLDSVREIEAARPHLLLPSLGMVVHRLIQDHRRRGLPVVAWTVRTEADLKAVGPHCDAFIFESLSP